MKILTYTLVCMVALTAMPAFGQQKSLSATETSPPRLTKFDLDFPGGTPSELIAAIQQAMGHPLNAIVPNEDATLKLPPLKMKSVDVKELFDALKQVCQTQQVTLSGNYYNTSFGFKSLTDTPSDESVWFCFNDSPQNLRITRFYLLTPYLDHGLTVDDITTAIHTGWKMLGDSPTPALSFHKETKLLIAMGNRSQIETVEEVLKALKPSAPSPLTKPDPLKTGQ